MPNRPRGVELGRASYQAVQMGSGELLLIARGVHPTTGFREFFEFQNPNSGRLPEFAFFFVTPSGATLPVLTPFQHHERFEMGERVDFVVIEDADGEHRIRVVHLEDDLEAEPEVRVLRATRAMALPTTAAQCRGCVRRVVAQWAHNDNFSNEDTLGDILRDGPCNGGAIAELAQALGATCAEPPDSIACGMTVRQLIELSC